MPHPIVLCACRCTLCFYAKQYERGRDLPLEYQTHCGCRQWRCFRPNPLTGWIARLRERDKQGA
jgi:hypothetical protein